jgi:hypothetical protein
MYETAPSDKIWEIYSFLPEDAAKNNAISAFFAKRFVSMLDVAISMLGPDLESLQEQLYDIGAVLERYEVMPHHYDLMGKALEYNLERKFSSLKS